MLLLFLIPLFTNVYPCFADELTLFNLTEPLKAELTFNKLSMEDAIKLALLNNPKVTYETANLESKKWSIKENKSYLFPQLSVQQSFVASDNPVQAFMIQLSQRNFNLGGTNLNYPGTEANFSTRIRLDQVLLDRKLYKKVDISKLEYEIQQQIGKKELQTLVFHTRKAYIDVQLMQQRVMNAKQLLEYARVHYDAVKHQKQVGSTSKSQLLSAKTLLEQREESLSKAQNDLNLAWIVLADLVGDESIVGYDLTESLAKNYSIDDVDILVRYAYLHRPEIANVELHKKKSVKEYTLAELSNSLTLSTTASWGVDTILDDCEIARSYTVGVFLDKNLFDGGLKKAKVKKAKANVSSHNALIDMTYKDVRLNVIRHYLSFKNAQERVDMTNSIIADAEESLRSYNERFKVGLSSNVDVEAAQAKLSQSLLIRTDALYDLKSAYISLQRSLGVSISDIIENKPLCFTDDSSNAEHITLPDVNKLENTRPEKKDE